MSSTDLHTNISAMKVALGFASDSAIRARVLMHEARLLELEEVGRQIDKARLLHSVIMRQINGGPALKVIRGPGQ